MCFPRKSLLLVVLLAPLAVLSWPAPRVLAPVDLSAPRMRELVGHVVAVDWFVTQCHPLDGALAARLRAWEREHRLAAIRTSLARVERDPLNAEVLRELRRDFSRIGRRLPMGPCEGLRTYLGQPRMALTRDYAAEVRRLVDGVEPVAAPPDPIVGFGLLRATRAGPDGRVTVGTEPVVLFASGRAVKDALAVRDPRAHALAHADAWGEWRRADGRVEVRAGGVWTRLQGDDLYDVVTGRASPRGLYRAADGDTVEFFPATDAGGRLVRRGRGGSRAGQYGLDGLALTVRYDDGAREEEVLFGVPDDPGTVWLDGVRLTAER